KPPFSHTAAYVTYSHGNSSRQEYLLEFTSEYDISEGLHPEFPGRGDMIVDFPEGKVEMDLFNLISALNPAIVKTGTRQRAAHEVPLLTATTSQVIDMEDMVAMSTLSGTPASMDKSPLDFSNEDPTPLITNQDKTESHILAETSQEVPPAGETTTSGFVPEINLEREVTVMGVLKNKGRRKRERSETEANAPLKVLRTDHASVRPALNTHGRGGEILSFHGRRSRLHRSYTLQGDKTKQDARTNKAETSSSRKNSRKSKAQETLQGFMNPKVNTANKITKEGFKQMVKL
ncbi:hypothetical protein Tco_1075544, partial [Tanacetum coccineum]